MNSELIDRNELNVPSDENDYEELVQFADDVMNASTVPAIVIPKGASNLDMLKAVFPNIKITYSKYDVEGTPHIIMAHGMDGVTSFTADWANAPYKKEGDGNAKGNN